jgi:ubiquinone/menaquinone biosynthesis C-methylase UbiE
MTRQTLDKNIERARYDRAARSYVIRNIARFGSISTPQPLRAAYKKYEFIAKRKVFQGARVLEIACGMGENTKIFLDCKAYVTATDISSESLKVLKNIFKNNPYLSTKNADIEYLPFKNSSFDFVCCAGGLSYGETNRVKKEIIRVLWPGGSLILIDSLDNNPIYKLNRLMHYFFGRRTFSTLKNMPTVESLNDLTKTFKSAQIYYFGALVFLLPLLNKITSDAVSAKILNKFDKKFQIKKSAFKFVLVASELKK